jgi:hypothetical protein
MSDLENIFRSSDKAELIENLEKELTTANKCIIITIEDKRDEFTYSSCVMTLGLENSYEAFGILEVAKQDLINDTDLNK